MNQSKLLLGDYLLFLKKIGNNSFLKIYQCSSLTSKVRTIAIGRVNDLLEKNSFRLKGKELIGHYKSDYGSLLVYDTYF